MADDKTVASPCIAYQRMQAKFQLISDLMGGTETMRKAARSWLPQEAKESDEQYNVRLNRSTFYNAFGNAVDSLSGRPFSKPVDFSEKLPKRVKELLPDIDLNGRKMEVFLNDCFKWALADGARYALVDKSPKPSDEKTAADEMRNNRRPYAVEIDPRNVTFWRYAVKNGAPILEELRIKETIAEKSGEWGEKEVTQYRVLKLVNITNATNYFLAEDEVWPALKGPDDPGTRYAWEVWRQVKDAKKFGVVVDETTAKRDADKWVKDDQGITDMRYIPLAQLYTGRKSGKFFEFRPPLEDLAWENIHHWQSRSDQNNILHVARVPAWFGKGLPRVTAEGQAIEYTISPNTVITTNADNADMKIIEHTGAAIEAGRQDLLDCESRMANLGTELLENSNENPEPTALQAGLKGLARFSPLAIMTMNVEQFADAVLDMMADWEQVYEQMPDEQYVTINKEFAIAADTASLTVLQNARNNGDISQTLLLEEFQRRGTISPTVSIPDEIIRAKNEAPIGLGLGADAGGGFGGGGAAA